MSGNTMCSVRNDQSFGRYDHQRTLHEDLSESIHAMTNRTIGCNHGFMFSHCCVVGVHGNGIEYCWFLLHLAFIHRDNDMKFATSHPTDAIRLTYKNAYFGR